MSAAVPWPAGVTVQENRHGTDSTVIREHLATLAAAADAAAVTTARAALISSIVEWMRSLARRMLDGAPAVRRWTETDDIVQGASLRLYRALGAVAPSDVQHFIRLAALQVRRELIDMTRRLGNAESFAANHETGGPDGAHRVEGVADTAADEPARLAAWSRFHATVELLPEAEREVFGMVWYLGLSQDAIAGLLGCSARTVRRRWDDAKQRVAAAFGGDPPE